MDGINFFFCISVLIFIPIDIRASDSILNSRRLSKAYPPYCYWVHINLKPDFYKTQEFEGRTVIGMKPPEKGSAITVHAKNLTVTKVEINGDTLDFDVLPDLEIISFRVSKALKEDSLHNFAIHFKGAINTNLEGLYMGSYIENNQRKWYLATYLKPTYARSFFPCFDEPNFRTFVNFKVHYPEQDGYKVVSNAAPYTISDNWIDYEWSPSMSPYLSALVVGDLSHHSLPSQDEINYTIWFRKDMRGLRMYASDLAPKAVKVMEDLTRQSYRQERMSKLDLVALPDHPAMVTEHGQVITFKEVALLWHEKQSGAASKQVVGGSIMHGVAHIWFGCFLTIDWWNDVWLNEGFARFFEYYGLAEIEKEWQMPHQFVVKVFQDVMVEDASLFSIPLSSPEEEVVNRYNIQEKLGSITHNKGASIIRMMMLLMGEKKFYSGIQYYVEQYYATKRKADFKNEDTPRVASNMLLAAWQRQLSGVLPEGYTMEDIMMSWLKNGGFPVVNVVKRRSTIEFSAERFFYNASSKNVWFIPITYTVSSNPKFDDPTVNGNYWLIEDDSIAAVDEDFLDNKTWIVVNLQSAAYIRVNYDIDLWKALENALVEDHRQIHVLNRAQIVDDVLELARAGRISYFISLNLLRYLYKETEYYPWYSAVRGFEFIRLRLDGDVADTAQLTDFVNLLFGKFYGSITDKSDHMAVLKRSFAVEVACELNYGKCREDLANKFASFIKDNEEVDPNLRRLTYCIGIASSDNDKNWHSLYAKMNATTIPSEVDSMLDALGCTQDANLLKLYLNRSLQSSSGLKTQDAHLVFEAVATKSRIGAGIALNFLINNFETILERYQYAGSILHILQVLGKVIRTEKQLGKLKKFASEPVMKDYTQQVQRSIACSKNNLLWDKDRKDDFIIALVEIEPLTEPTLVVKSGAKSVETDQTLLLPLKFIPAFYTFYYAVL